MMWHLSSSSIAAIGAVWLTSLATAECRNSSAAPPSYPETRTLVKLQPAQVSALEDADYNLWNIDDSDSVSEFSANGLNFTIKATSEGDKLVGDAVTSVYTKPFPDVGQRLIGSGITTESDGGSITLTISGLPAGEHWLSSWHNAWEDLDDVPSIALVINGKGGISGRPITSQDTNRYGDALIHSWTVFTSDGDTTEVVYKPRDGNVYLNGFEIDSESMGRQIRFPNPVHREEKVEAPDGVVAASWERTFNVDGDEFNVYIGTSPDNMLLVADQIYDPEFKFTGLESETTYYWRVDVWDTWWDEALLGRTLTFTTA